MTKDSLKNEQYRKQIHKNTEFSTLLKDILIILSKNATFLIDFLMSSKNV